MSERIIQEDAEAASEWIRDNANNYAKAKAERIMCEEWRKTQKALLFQQAPQGSIADREAYAYAHADYQKVLEGLKAAVVEEERLKWLMTAAELRIDIWRTTEASNRRG
jgi:hypothetical protein